MRSYQSSIQSTRSRFLLRKGKAVWYDWYSHPNGARWIVLYHEQFYKIIHDGTGNQFFCSHAPRKISEAEAKEILSEYEKAWEEARKLWNWESLDEYLEKNI